MVTTAPSNIIGYEKYKVERQTKESLLLSIVAEFWIAVVNIFGALYKVKFKSVYCKIDKAKITPQETQRYIKAFYEVSPGTIPFTITSPFKEGFEGAER